MHLAGGCEKDRTHGVLRSFWPFHVFPTGGPSNHHLSKIAVFDFEAGRHESGSVAIREDHQ